MSDLAETMQSLQTIAEQCLPDSWENDGAFLSCREATDNFNLEPVYKCQFCETMLKGTSKINDICIIVPFNFSR